MRNSHWQRATRKHPCPICGRPNRCIVPRRSSSPYGSDLHAERKPEAHRHWLAPFAAKGGPSLAPLDEHAQVRGPHDGSEKGGMQ